MYIIKLILINSEICTFKWIYWVRLNHSDCIFEATTGLHFYDISLLMRSFDRMIAKGHTLVIIEHNPDVIKCADHIIDMGPDGGDAGGQVVAEGTPEQVAANPRSITGKYLNLKA